VSLYPSSAKNRVLFECQAGSHKTEQRCRLVTSVALDGMGWEHLGNKRKTMAGKLFITPYLIPLGRSESLGGRDRSKAQRSCCTRMSGEMGGVDKTARALESVACVSLCFGSRRYHPRVIRYGRNALSSGSDLRRHGRSFDLPSMHLSHGAGGNK
jgi:hypothetical protein